MATYAEIAPNISATGITKTQVENYFSNMPEKPAPQPEANITKAKVQAVANAYYVTGIEAAGGIKQLASDNNLSPSQVKNLLEEMNKLYGAWSVLNNPQP